MTPFPKIPILHRGSLIILVVESKPTFLKAPKYPDTSAFSPFSETTHQIHQLTSSLLLYRQLNHSHRQLEPSTIEVINQILASEGRPPLAPLTRPHIWQSVEDRLTLTYTSLLNLPPNDYSYALRDYLTASFFHPNHRKMLIGLTYDKPYNAIVRPLVTWLNNEDRRRNSQRTYFSY